MVLCWLGAWHLPRMSRGPIYSSNCARFVALVISRNAHDFFFHTYDYYSIGTRYI